MRKPSGLGCTGCGNQTHVQVSFLNIDYTAPRYLQYSRRIWIYWMAKKPRSGLGEGGATGLKIHYSQVATLGNSFDDLENGKTATHWFWGGHYKVKNSLFPWAHCGELSCRSEKYCMVKLPHSGFEGDIIGLELPYSLEHTVWNSLADLENSAW